MTTAGGPVLVQLLRARAAEAPDAPAFIVVGGDELTYAAWERRSNALARGLRERRMDDGARVVLWFDRAHWTDYAVAYAGAHKAGAVAVPVGGEVSPLEMARVVSHCRASALVVADVASAGAAVRSGAWVADPGELEMDQDDGELSPRARPPDPVDITYRCLPLRRPQPSRHPHAAILSRLAAQDAAAPPSAGASLLHAFAVGTEGGRQALWFPLAPGRGPVVTLAAFDPEGFCALTGERRVSRWGLAPAVALLVADSGALERHDVSTVTQVVLSGGRARPSLLSRLAAALPGASLLSVAPEPDAVATEGGPHVPVAASQEGMLWHEQFVPGSQNLPPLVRRYRGPLDVEVLSQALSEIVRRHEPLRTTFELWEGRATQVVSPPEPLPLPLRDLSGLAEPDQEAELARLLADAGRPFDLVTGPLFEAMVVRLGADDHVVVFRVHHSVYDDWSVGVFRRELSALYAALAGGEGSPLPDLPLTFSEFSRDQHRRLAGPEGGAELSWWKDRLAGAPLCLQLPIDDPDRPEGSPQSSAEPVSITLPPELRLHLAALARRERATVFMAMLAAFQVLVHRYTGQSELLLSAVVANRNRTELEGMIGCFTKKIVLRHDVGGDPTFAELLARTRAVLLGALSHQDLPFEAVLQEALGAPAAAHGLAPYSVVMFQGVTPGAEDVVLAGMTTSGYDTSATTRRAHFIAGPDREAPGAAAPVWGGGLYSGTFLILSMEAGESLSLVARGAFHRPAVERLLDNFGALLADVVARPFRAVSELTTSGDRERTLLGAWNATGDELPLNRCSHDLFESQVARAPSRPALRCDREVVTYGELDARANALAGGLRAAGVEAGTLVGLCLPPSVDCVVAVLAVWKAGAGFVALDEHDSDDRLAFVLEQASVQHVLARPDVGRPILGRRSRLVSPHATGPATTPSPARVDPATPALAFYGSGPSAVPRGVVVQHRSVVNLVAGLRRGIYEPSFDDPRREVRVALSAAPTDDAFVRQLAAVLDGRTLCVVGADAGPGAEELVSSLRDDVVDLVDCCPAQIRALAAAGLAGALAARSGGAATPVITVGSRTNVDTDVAETLRGLEAAHVYSLLGSPECSFGATLELVPRAAGRVTVGRPMVNVTIEVLDVAGRPVPVQAAGELLVGGASVARGYLGAPEEADGWFLPGPVPGEAAKRLYRTGLLARHLPDGKIEVLGAVKDSVDLRGFRVDRSRIEAALRTCPGVREVRVAVDDGLPPRLVAHVVPDGDQAPTLAQLHVWLWRQLPGYAWPQAMVVATEPPAPPEGTSPTPEEALLAALWADVLDVEEVAVEENYWQRFSFLDVVARAREAGITISGRQVTRNRTIATLAADLAADRSRPRA